MKKYIGAACFVAVGIVLSGRYESAMKRKPTKCVGRLCDQNIVFDEFIIKNDAKVLNEAYNIPVLDQIGKPAEKAVKAEGKPEANPVNETQQDLDFGIIWNDMTVYNRTEFLGNGTFADAYRVTKDNETFVLKHFKRTLDAGSASARRKELRMYKALQEGPNIARFIEAVRDPNNVTDTGYIIENINMTNPYHMIYKLTKEDLEYYFYHMMVGLEYIHSKQIIHGDLKLHNIAVDVNKRIVRILDLGTARYHFPDKEKEWNRGTIPYRAPEMLLQSKNFTTAVDMWAMGCIFANMLFNKTSHFKFKNDNYTDLIGQITDQVGSFRIQRLIEKYNMTWPYNETLEYKPAGNWTKFINKKNEDRVSEEALDLLSKMLTADPYRRITAKQALKHKFFSRMRMESRKNDLKHLLFSPIKEVSKIFK